jgi:PHO85 cyclin-6/7
MELNQLELQFLLLNDFNLVVSSAEMQRYAEQLILFSRSEGALQSSQTCAIPEVSGPTRAMGAFDAYGGRIEGQPAHQSSSTQAYHQPYFRGKDDEDDDASVASAETETEGGDTTDDEPTIRPACRDSEDDSRSMCSTSTTESDDWGSEREHDARASIDHSKEEGESTPEQFATPGKERMDHRMASP